MSRAEGGSLTSEPELVLHQHEVRARDLPLLPAGLQALGVVSGEEGVGRLRHVGGHDGGGHGIIVVLGLLAPRQHWGSGSGERGGCGGVYEWESFFKGV